MVPSFYFDLVNLGRSSIYISVVKCINRWSSACMDGQVYISMLYFPYKMCIYSLTIVFPLVNSVYPDENMWPFI